MSSPSSLWSSLLIPSTTCLNYFTLSYKPLIVFHELIYFLYTLRTLPPLRSTNPRVIAYFCHMNNGWNISNGPRTQSKHSVSFIWVHPHLYGLDAIVCQCVRCHSECSLGTHSMNEDFMWKNIWHIIIPTWYY